MVPYLQPSGQVMVDLKLWFQSDLLKVTKVWLLTVAFLFCFSPPNALFFVIDHTTKLGMKDLLKDQQWWVERDSNLIPPQYRPNALTTTPCSPIKKCIQSYSGNHYSISSRYDQLFSVTHLFKTKGKSTSSWYPWMKVFMKLWQKVSIIPSVIDSSENLLGRTLQRIRLIKNLRQSV